MIPAFCAAIPGHVQQETVYGFEAQHPDTSWWIDSWRRRKYSTVPLRGLRGTGQEISFRNPVTNPGYGDRDRSSFHVEWTT